MEVSRARKQAAVGSRQNYHAARRRSTAAFCLLPTAYCLLFTAACLSGCGYTTRPGIAAHLKTIYVKPFVNKIDVTRLSSGDERFPIYRHQMEVDLTRAVIDRLYKEGAGRPKIMVIAIHPYISGQPFRIKYLEQVYARIAKAKGVVHWNGEQILEWYLKAKPKAKSLP